MSPKLQRQRPGTESHLVRKPEPIRTGTADDDASRPASEPASLSASSNASKQAGSTAGISASQNASKKAGVNDSGKDGGAASLRPPRRVGRPRGPTRVALTVRILRATDERLTAAVEATGRSPQYLVDEALARYLEQLGL